MSHRSPLPAALLVALLLPACGSDAADPSGGGSTACPDEARLACAVDQFGCGMVGGEPTCQPCPSQQFASPDGTCTPIPGTSLEHTFPGHTTAAGEEIKGQCRSWTVGNDTELWVNAVELEQSEASHHSNWMFVPEDRYDGPDGLWPCRDRDYDQLSAALLGGVLYAQSTQAMREVQKFPPGVVIRIPPRVRIISDVHLYNTTTEDITGTMTIRLHTIPPEEATVRLAPFHVSYDTLDIPPRATSRFAGTCDLRDQFAGLGQPSVDLDVYYLLPHTHALGVRMFVEVAGGPSDGASLVDVRGFNGEARGRRWDEPMRIRGADGLRFGCEFDNPRNVNVAWGFGDQEMCEALGFAASPVSFESRISEVLDDGSEGAMPLFTGACDTIAFNWNR